MFEFRNCKAHRKISCATGCGRFDGGKSVPRPHAGRAVRDFKRSYLTLVSQRRTGGGCLTWTAVVEKSETA